MNKNLRKTHVWFMRQAGRYLPEYKAIRQTEKSFLDLCFNPEKASTVSLQPIKRFNFDFIILFSDILVIPHALGQTVDFRENIGPVLKKVNFEQEICSNSVDFENSLDVLNPVFETVKLIKEKEKNKELIGFCGGAFTVLTYMIEGGSSKNHTLLKKTMKNEKKLIKKIMRVIENISVQYLVKQIESGVDKVMIFESWAGLLDKEDYFEYVIESNQRIILKIKEKFKKIPVISFPRGSKDGILDYLNNVECDVISLDKYFPKTILDIDKYRDITFQGNLDPQILFEGGIKLEKEVKKIMLTFKEKKHIFNLSHGILPKTPIKNVEQTLRLIRDFDATR